MHPRLPTKSLSAALGVMLLSGAAFGQAHEALLLVNPNNAQSLYVSNVYASARGLPGSGLAYFDPAPANFNDFVASRVPAVLGTIANHRNSDSVDYILLTPDAPYRISAPGLVSDACSPVNSFSLSGAYTMTRYVSVVQGGVGSLLSNGYYSSTGATRAFDNALTYVGGNPGTGPLNGKPFIGCALGYTGSLGTTLGQVLTMIDTSAGADGSFPAGTFRFLQTGDAARSGPRHGSYTGVVNRITAAGGSAVKTIGPNLPSGGELVMGAMSGFAADDIDAGNFTFAPGAFGDHLTSYAADFDNGQQTKMSRWISKGAVGTFGAVEEPCNYPNKFPSANMHAMYFDGLTMGEACLRSLAAVPFQGMMMGDPLCRPFAHIPAVNPGSLPSGPVTGNFTLTPNATTTHPTAAISLFEVYVDGVLRASEAPGVPLVVRTGNYDDGWHELRVVAYDNTLVATQGEWVGSFTTNNGGKTVSATAPVATTDRSGTIQTVVSASGGTVVESRLLHNDRVVAAIAGTGTLATRGEIVGAGPVRLRVEVDFADGRTARSGPLTTTVFDVLPSTGAGGPTAYDFRKTVKPGQAYVLELPALHTTALSEPTFAITSGPTKGTVLGGSGRFRIIQANAGATGTDQIGFSVTSNGVTDAGVATVSFYDPDAQPCKADTNFDGILSAADFSAWIQAYNFGLVFIADQNADGLVTPADFSAWITNFNVGCDF